MVSEAYKDFNVVMPEMPARSSICTTAQAVKPNRLGSVDPTPTSVSCKCLPATTVPTLRSITVPSLLRKSTRQDLCQDEKIFYWATFAWGQLTPGTFDPTFTAGDSTMCARTRENIKNPNRYAGLAMPLMEIDLRTIIYNHYSRLGTMYSPVRHNYRRTQRKWT